VITYFRRVAPAALAIALTAAAPASGLIEPGNIAAPPSNPYPTQPGVMVNGTLLPDSDPRCGGHCLDYLKVVASAGETIEFTDQNTTSGINPNTCYKYCPVYLSLVDSNFKDPGGVSAGTFATYGDTEVFDWTFQAPGTYYMVMEGEGDATLNYAVSYKIVSGGPGGGPGPKPGPSAPLVRSLRVLSHQRGIDVEAAVTLGQWAKSLRVSLFATAATKAIVVLKRAPDSPGRHKFELTLPFADQQMLKARHQLSLVVRITVHDASGASLTFKRRVTLSD
jgi:hypothetical protein